MVSNGIEKYAVRGLDNESRAERLRSVLLTYAGITRVDVNKEKKLVRIVSATPITLDALNRHCAPDSFVLSVSSMRSATFECAVLGMTCHSCEVTIERKWKCLPNVTKVHVNAAKGTAQVTYCGAAPSLETLGAAIADEGYRVHASARSVRTPVERPSGWQLVGFFALVLVLGALFSRLGWLRPSTALGASVGFGAAFFIGLVAASSSCIAVAGGLLLGSSARFRERYGDGTLRQRLTPVVLFVGGRIAGYTFFGALIGLLGSALTPSPFVTGAITVFAALVMFTMGLEMLGIAPAWLRALKPRMPKALAHRVLDGEQRAHPVAPLALGAATFFLPCGFTQALQLYALSTGSAVTGALILFAFALGTAPALLALGWASGSFKGKFGTFFFRFSGALVVVLGLWNMNNGLALAGYPISVAALIPERSASVEVRGGVDDPAVTYDGREQVVRMTVGYSGYSPNRFTIRAGVPTRLLIDGTDAGGCATVFTIPRLGVQRYLKSGTNEIAFTAPAPGVIPFSCSMGMFRGEMRVVNNES